MFLTWVFLNWNFEPPTTVSSWLTTTFANVGTHPDHRPGPKMQKWLHSLFVGIMDATYLNSGATQLEQMACDTRSWSLMAIRCVCLKHKICCKQFEHFKGIGFQVPDRGWRWQRLSPSLQLHTYNQGDCQDHAAEACAWSLSPTTIGGPAWILALLPRQQVKRKRDAKHESLSCLLES